MPSHHNTVIFRRSGRNSIGPLLLFSKQGELIRNEPRTFNPRTQESLCHGRCSITETLSQQAIPRNITMGLRPYPFIQISMSASSMSPMVCFYHQKRLMDTSRGISTDTQQKLSQVAQTFSSSGYFYPCSQGNKKSQTTELNLTNLQNTTGSKTMSLNLNTLSEKCSQSWKIN